MLSWTAPLWHRIVTRSVSEGTRYGNSLAHALGYLKRGLCAQSGAAQLVITTFKATTEGTDKLGLRVVLEHYANDQWLPVHYTEEQRVGIVFDQFKRQVEQELKLLVLEVDED